LIVVLAIVFLALHLPYLPKSLEDLDSINFALGVRHFDVAHHQPHPPGYPVFILIAKALHAVVPAEATALALLSAIAAALGVLGLAALYRRLDGDDGPARWSAAAVAVAMTTPLYWFTAVRPISDSSGLAAAIGVQAMTLAASTARGLFLAGFCAGLAAGLRSQVAWLTVPLLALRAFQGLGAGDWGLGAGSAVIGSEPLPPSPQPLAPSTKLLAPSPQSLLPVVAAFVAGILVWLVPLVIISGGPAAYTHAVFDQGAEDLGNIQMLWTRHGARDVVDALYYALAAPWAAWPVAAVALTCAFAGLLRLAATRRRTLILLAAAFLPYFVFDLLFQETFTSRYALPLVVPMAYLAVAGLRLVPWDLGLAVAVALAMFCAHAGGTSIAAYSRVAAPAFRLLGTMGVAARHDRVTPVLAMDRRQSLDLRRPIAWIGDAMPNVALTLPSPPQHEWMEAVKYWNGGGVAPVWFVVDPLRASIDLVQHGAPLTFRWAVPYPVLLGGTRPNEMDWYRVDRPEWYVGEGWALTPEAAGVADADRRDPSHGPITGWVRGSASSGGTLMIGGRSFDPTLRPRLSVTLDGLPLLDDTLTPGAFLKFVSLPFSQRDNRAPAYDAVTVTTTAGARIAVEQFDASTTRPLMGFGEGWHEQELNPMTGRRWRWLSRRGELRIVVEPVALPPSAIRLHPAGSLVLHLEGESPRTYFPRGSRLVVRSREQVAFDRVLSSDFSLDVPIENAADTIVLETDQSYVPAERSRRSQDRRQLGLRIFKAEIRKTDRPAS
jgi:hypothetical protein